MDEAKFWELLEPGRRDPDPKNQLRAALMKLEPEELEAFQARLDAVFERANQWALRSAVALIERDDGDERFDQFRFGLIMRGKTIYDAALRDPDSLAYAEVKADPDAGYLAFDVYEMKKGCDMPRPDSPRPPPTGTRWNANEIGRRLPKLSAKYK